MQKIIPFFCCIFALLCGSAAASENNSSGDNPPAAAAKAAGGQDSKISRYAVIDTASGAPKVVAVVEHVRTGGAALVTRVLETNPKTGVAWTAGDLRGAGFNTEKLESEK